MEFCIYEKGNNSIATIFFWITVNKNQNIFSEQHNSMTILYRALFKYENEREISWESLLTTLQFTHMKWRVEKGDVLGWTPSTMFKRFRHNLLKPNIKFERTWWDGVERETWIIINCSYCIYNGTVRKPTKK